MPEIMSSRMLRSPWSRQCPRRDAPQKLEGHDLEMRTMLMGVTPWAVEMMETVSLNVARLDLLGEWHSD